MSKMQNTSKSDRNKFIGIITIAHGANYGNKLQNFALTKVLESLGFCPETLPQRVSILTTGKKWLLGIRHPSNFLRGLRLDIKRQKVFDRFTNEYIPASQYINNRRLNLSDISGRYIAIVLGSDQIWNPHFRMYNRAAMFGYGLREGQAIPYAPSFGVSTIPEDKKAEITKYLNALSHIAVREKNGVELVKELTGRIDVVHVLDPTMLLDADDYRRVARKPKYLANNKRYILTYFLGETANVHRDDIVSFAKKQNFDIINLNDINNNKTYVYGPSEFLYLFDHATLILTDSFHATVFSITFRRPFVVYGRERKNEASMNSRIDSLLSIVDMQERYNVDLGSDILHIDYSKVDRLVKNERKKSLAYLEKALVL